LVFTIYLIVAFMAAILTGRCPLIEARRVQQTQRGASRLGSLHRDSKDSAGSV
jgi:hypothetical protein